MLCQKCKKNEATVYYKENINGHVTEYNLCPECAAELEKNGVLHLDSHAEDLFGERVLRRRARRREDREALPGLRVDLR